MGRKQERWGRGKDDGGGGAGEVNRVRLPTAKDQVVFISGDRTQISRALIGTHFLSPIPLSPPSGMQRCNRAE